MVAVFVFGAAAFGTVVIRVKNNGKSKRSNSSSMFDDEARDAASKARVDGIKDVLKAMEQKARDAETKLDAVIQEKNTIERMLEDMERMRANMVVENRELRDSVTVLKSDLNAKCARHELVVRKWRDELVTYREKSPQDFLAEVIGLVSDMDNEVTIEVIEPEQKPNAVKHEEVRLEECEWEHNPRLAVNEPTRLLMLANSGRSVGAARTDRFNKVLSTTSKRVASPQRATTPTRMALGKLTNTGVQRANAAVHKAHQLIDAKRAAMHTPPPTSAKADRSIEFGECLLFEKSVSTPNMAQKISASSRAGVIAETAFSVEDVIRPFSAHDEGVPMMSPSRAVALRR
jgi:hypothetical protein